MRPDIQIPRGSTALPPAPAPRSSRRPAYDIRLTATLVLTTWALGAALLAQQLHIDRLRRESVDARAEATDVEERLSTLTSSQASIRERLDGLFDPSRIVGSAASSVFTLLAGPLQGSAFVMSSTARASELVTNFHVVRAVWTAGGRRVVVRAEGRSFNGTIVRVAPSADLAIVEVDAFLPSLIPTTSALTVGEPIVALGSPYGYGGTASTGIVSAIRGRYVQFSAPVSPGSSGGPVLDGDGRVIAVTTAKVVGHGVEGLSFAIPIDRVCRLTAAC